MASWWLGDLDLSRDKVFGMVSVARVVVLRKDSLIPALKDCKLRLRVLLDNVLVSMLVLKSRKNLPEFLSQETINNDID